MKKLVFLGFILCFSSNILAQKLDTSTPPAVKRSFKEEDNKTVVINQIECTFTNSVISDAVLKKIIKNPDNWRVLGRRSVYPVKKVGTSLEPNKCWLRGNWDLSDSLVVAFKAGDGQEQQLGVDSKEVKSKKTNWGFGQGKAFDLNAQRLFNQKNVYAFDYDIKVNVIESTLSASGGNFWFRSLSFNLASTGIVASDETARNGTQSSLSLALNPFYFVAGLIYRSELSASYQIETGMNDAEDNVFDVINKSFKFGAEIEVPLTNYPIFKLHTKTGYVRLAMPLILNLDYLPTGDDGNGGNSLARWDLKARYELAFSPYLIAKGEWHRSKLKDAPMGIDNTATYYSISFAQDLDVVKKTLGVLKFILGPQEEIRGKNFIFFKISKGRKAPAFEDIDEKLLGFGTYF